MRAGEMPKTYDDFEAVRADLQSNVTKSDRNAYSKAAMIERIKKNNNFIEYLENLQVFYDMVDTSIFARRWDAAGASHLDNTLFSIGDREIPQKSFADYLAANQGGRSISIEVLVNTKYKQFVEEQVLQYEEDQLPGKYPEFRHLVQEYHDGILLFDLTDQMVWSKAVEDTVGLEAFFKEHKNGYKWEKRMDATLYTCRDEEVAAYARELLGNPKNKKLGAEQIQSKAFKEFADSSCLVFENRLLEAGDHSLIENMDWSKDRLSEVQTKDGKSLFLVNNKVLKPSAKEMDECRGLITADYQNYLEKKWIESLRMKYPVKVNEELLSGIE